MGKLIHEALSEEIIGAAMAVLNELKPGLDEKLYENALVIELRERGYSVNQQKAFLCMRERGNGTDGLKSPKSFSNEIRTAMNNARQSDDLVAAIRRLGKMR